MPGKGRAAELAAALLFMVITMFPSAGKLPQGRRGTAGVVGRLLWLLGN